MNDTHNQQAIPLKQLLGTKVHNSNGDELGRLEEVVVNMDRSNLHYAILSFGNLASLIGVGGKFYTVPWQLLQLNSDASAFVLDLPFETIKNAPRFDKEEWPNLADHKWEERLSEYYGFSQNWGESIAYPDKISAAE